MSGWTITAPFLSEEDAAAALAPGGLSGGADPGDTARGILLGLQTRSHLYGGTVSPGVVAHRRAKNKAARKARRITRRAS